MSELEATAAPQVNTTSVAPVSNEAGSTTPAASSASAEDSGGHWANTLGADYADKFKDFSSVDEAIEAAQRGKNYTPAKSAEDFDLGVKPTNAADAKLHDSFKQYCLECGVTPKMAKELAEWNMKTNAEMRQAQFEAGQADLRSKWGATYDTKVNGALSMVTALDKRLEGRLSKELAFSGGNNNPTIVETLYVLSTLISEDSLTGAGTGSGEEKPMNTLDFLKSEVFKNKE